MKDIEIPMQVDARIPFTFEGTTYLVDRNISNKPGDILLPDLKTVVRPVWSGDDGMPIARVNPVGTLYRAAKVDKRPDNKPPGALN